MERKSWFVNLSNHPSEKWEVTQMAAALHFGEVEDLAFPNIRPEDSRSDIEELAGQYVQMIAKRKEKDDLVVHVMGEMTFTYAVVARLKDLGIRCVASTTERRVVETADGKTLSEFRFVRFRDY